MEANTEFERVGLATAREPAAVRTAAPVTSGNEAAADPGAMSEAALTQIRARIIHRDSTTRRLLAVADCFAVAVSLTVAAVIADSQALGWATLAAPIFVVLVAKTIGLYDRDEHLLHKTTLDEFPTLFALATTSALIFYLAGGLLVSEEPSREQTALFWGLMLVLLIFFRSVARGLSRTVTADERCMFVGDADDAEEFRQKLATSPLVDATLVGWIPVTDAIDAGNGDRVHLFNRIQAVVQERQVERVILGPEPGGSEELLDSIRKIKGFGVKVSVLPDAARVVNSSVELDRLNGISLLGVRRFEITNSSRYLKRGFDLLGSSIAIVITFPLLVLTAIAIKLDSAGPVLFAQRRAGRHGTPFNMVKFRSMVDGADELKDELRHLNEADGVFKIPNDPRITRVGRLIRALHIDELPQLINVLRGDMSLVGPRPLPLDEDLRIEGWHRRRLDLRPGITGAWQVLGSSRIPVREMVRLDYQYVADWSLWNDVRILLLTISHIARRRGQ